MTNRKKTGRLRFIGIALFATFLLIVFFLGSVNADLLEPKKPVLSGGPKHISESSINGAFIPILEADGQGRLMLAYNHKTAALIENPYYRTSADEGRTWDAPAAIRNSSAGLLQVDIAFDGNDMAHAVWRTETTIWHAPENQWPNVENQVAPAADLVLSPDIAIAPNNTLHIVWAEKDDQDYSIEHAYSSTNGTSWIVSSPVISGAVGTEAPAIAVDQNGDVHVAWEERRINPGPDPSPIDKPFLFEIKYKKGTVSQGSISWDSSPTLISEGLFDSRMPAVALDGNDVYITFARRESSIEQYAYLAINSSGSGWSPSIDLTQGDPLIMNTNIPFVLIPEPDFCKDGLNVYFHGALASNNKERIMGVKSSDSWANRTQVTDGDSRSIRPSMVCIGGMLHVVYEKVIEPGVDHQIYYTAGYAHAVYVPLIIRS